MPAASRKPVIPAPTVRQRLVALAAQDVLEHLNPSVSPVSLEEGVAICRELMEFLAHRYRDEEGDSPEAALEKLKKTRCVIWIPRLNGYDTNEERIPLTAGGLRGNSLPNDRQYYAGHFARLAAWQIGGVRHFVHELTLRGPEDPLYPGGARSTPIDPSVLNVKTIEEWDGYTALDTTLKDTVCPSPQPPTPPTLVLAITGLSSAKEIERLEALLDDPAFLKGVAEDFLERRRRSKQTSLQETSRRKPRASSSRDRVAPTTPPSTRKSEHPSLQDMIHQHLQNLSTGLEDLIALIKRG